MQTKPSQLTETVSRPTGIKMALLLFWEFIKLGAFTFGSGWSIIAQMEQEFVDKRKWLTKSAKIPAPHAVLVSTNVRLKRSPQETFTRSIPASAPSAEPAPTSARPNRFTWNKSEPTAIKPFLGRGTVLLYPDPLHTDGYGKNLPQSPRSRFPDRRRSPRPL